MSNFEEWDWLWGWEGMIGRGDGVRKGREGRGEEGREAFIAHLGSRLDLTVLFVLSGSLCCGVTKPE